MRGIKGTRITFVVTHAIDGATRTLREAMTLHSAGAIVTVIARGGKEPSKLFAEVPFDFLVPTAPRLYSDNKIWAIRVFLNLTYYKFMDWYWRNHMNDINYVGKKVPADIVQAVNPYSLSVASVVASHHGAKFVYEAFEFFQGSFLDSLADGGSKLRDYIRNEEKYIGETDGVITVSKSISSKIKTHYSYEGSMIEVYNSPRCQEGPKASNATDPVRFVFHGVVYQAHNVENLLRAFARVEEGWIFDIWGRFDVRYKERIDALIDELNINDKVTYRGEFTQETALSTIGQYDVGIYPAMPANDNYLNSLPNKFFDCICAGLCLAMPDFINMREIIEKEENGIILDTTSISGIEEGIRFLVQNPEKVTQMKRQSAGASLKYSWNAQENNLIDFYLNLLNRA